MGCAESTPLLRIQKIRAVFKHIESRGDPEQIAQLRRIENTPVYASNAFCRWCAEGECTCPIKMPDAFPCYRYRTPTLKNLWDHDYIVMLHGDDYDWLATAGT